MPVRKFALHAAFLSISAALASAGAAQSQWPPPPRKVPLTPEQAVEAVRKKLRDSMTLIFLEEMNLQQLGKPMQSCASAFRLTITVTSLVPSMLTDAFADTDVEVVAESTLDKPVGAATLQKCFRELTIFGGASLPTQSLLPGETMKLVGRFTLKKGMDF